MQLETPLCRPPAVPDWWCTTCLLPKSLQKLTYMEVLTKCITTYYIIASTHSTLVGKLYSQQSLTSTFLTLLCNFCCKLVPSLCLNTWIDELIWGIRRRSHTKLVEIFWLGVWKRPEKSVKKFVFIQLDNKCRLRNLPAFIRFRAF